MCAYYVTLTRPFSASAKSDSDVQREIDDAWCVCVCAFMSVCVLRRGLFLAETFAADPSISQRHIISCTVRRLLLIFRPGEKLYKIVSVIKIQMSANI